MGLRDTSGRHRCRRLLLSRLIIVGSVPSAQRPQGRLLIVALPAFLPTWSPWGTTVSNRASCSDDHTGIQNDRDSQLPLDCREASYATQDRLSPFSNPPLTTRYSRCEGVFITNDIPDQRPKLLQNSLRSPAHYTTTCLPPMCHGGRVLHKPYVEILALLPAGST